MVKNFVEVGKKIVAIGRNYGKHAKEMGSSIPTIPIVFLKPTTSYLTHGKIKIPETEAKHVHHEVELAVVIGKKGKNIKEKDAMNHVSGYALSLDMTARRLQKQAQADRLPWTISKGYDSFTPISNFIPKELVRDPHNLQIWAKVNDEMRQNGNTTDMIFKIPKLIEYVSSIMTLEPGDTILTGTPEGVGPLLAGETITCGLGDTSKDNLATIKFEAE